jgi:hypothetical protein
MALTPLLVSLLIFIVGVVLLFAAFSTPGFQWYTLVGGGLVGVSVGPLMAFRK